MNDTVNKPLIIAAALSAIAAILHVAIIFGGPEWYRFFGAGEGFASAAAAGSWRPAIITSGVVLVFVVWTLYALSGAGVIRPLPLLRIGLMLITGIYLLRGLVFVPVAMLNPAGTTAFLVWSSLVCLVFGSFYLLGLVQVWQRS